MSAADCGGSEVVQGLEPRPPGTEWHSSSPLGNLLRPTAPPPARGARPRWTFCPNELLQRMRPRELAENLCSQPVGLWEIVSHYGFKPLCFGLAC